jgi:Zn-dependent M28 family amino/carboxypeptidase
MRWLVEKWRARRAARRGSLRAELRGLVRGLVVLACVVLYMTQPLVSRARSEAAPAADAGNLERDVRLISTAFGPRDHLHADNLDRVAGYIRQALEAAGGRVSDQPFRVNGRAYRNVIASFGPDDGERIVVGAHYDAFGPGPGADDNASGVAGLLELARLLGRTAPATRVDLVAYTLEEPPYFKTEFMGSAVHARSLAKEGVRLRAMISLEMIGCFSDAAGSQDYPNRLIGLLYPTEGNFIAVIGNLGGGLLVRRIKGAMSSATELPVRSLNAPRFALGVDLSDQLNYWDAGYDAVMVTDTASFRNKHYHTALDTADRLDFGRMSRVVQGVHAAVHELARE